MSFPKKIRDRSLGHNCAIFPFIAVIFFHLLVKFTVIHIAFLMNQRKTHLTLGGGGLDLLESCIIFVAFFFFLKIFSVFSSLLSQFMFCYLSFRANSLRAAVEIVLETEYQSISVCQLVDGWLKKKYIHLFTLMDRDLPVSELEVREDAEITP